MLAIGQRQVLLGQLVGQLFVPMSFAGRSNFWHFILGQWIKISLNLQMWNLFSLEKIKRNKSPLIPWTMSWCRAAPMCSPHFSDRYETSACPVWSRAVHVRTSPVPGTRRGCRADTCMLGMFFCNDDNKRDKLYSDYTRTKCSAKMFSYKWRINFNKDHKFCVLEKKTNNARPFHKVSILYKYISLLLWCVRRFRPPLHTSCGHLLLLLCRCEMDCARMSCAAPHYARGAHATLHQ